MNKLGFYVESTTVSGLADAIRDVRPPTLLVHAGDRGLLQEIRRSLSPDTFVIGRMFVAQDVQNAWLEGGDPEGRGRALADKILGFDFGYAHERGANGRLLVDAWMSLNESVPGPASEAYKTAADGGAALRARAGAYDRFQDAFRRRLSEGNEAIEAVAFNFGAGNFPDAKSYIDWFPLTLESYVYLGFHEYGWPALSQDVIAGSASSAYTYHAIMAGLRQKYGPRHKAIITEAGLARAYRHPTDPAGDVGWLYEPDAVSQEDYLRSLEWYNTRLCQDDYVVGACLFSVGPGGDQAKWKSFRHLGVDHQGRPLQIMSRLKALAEAGPVATAEPAQPAVTQLAQPKPAVPRATPAPAGSRTCRVGMHGRNDRLFADGDYQVIREAKIETVKMMSLTDPSVFRRIKDENPAIEFITRLYGGGFGTGGHPSAQAYAQEMIPVMGTLQPYCHKFQIHNEPNHAARIEGWGKEDADAQSFNQWFLEVYDLLKQAHPWASLGFPGLAVPDFAHRTKAWLRICRPAIEKADWLGVHSYWQTRPDGYSVLLDAEFGLTFKYYHDLYPTKRLEIVECGNSNIQRPKGDEWPIKDETVAQEYVRWLREVFKYDYIGSASFFIASSPDRANWEFFSWRTEGNFRKPVVQHIRDMERPPWRDMAGPAPALPKPAPPAAKPTPPAAKPAQAPVKAAQAPVKPAQAPVKAAQAPVKPAQAPVKAAQAAVKPAQAVATPTQPAMEPAHPAVQPTQPAPTATRWTNQQVINAFNKASLSLGLGNWKLMDMARIKLDNLAKARKAPYTGPAIDQIPTLTAEQKALIQQKLSALAAGTLEAFALDAGVFLWQAGDLLAAALALPRRQHLSLTSAIAPAERRAATAWNRYGNLLMQAADALGIDPASAVAVIAAHGSRRGLAPDGRLVIRFEPDLFYERWGREHEAAFARYFKLDPRRADWKPQCRPGAEEGWHPCRGSQDDEWRAFGLARALDEDAAKRATRLGLAKVLGAQHAALGYESAEQMFDAFSSGERYQVLGVLDRIAGPEADPRLLDALRARDWQQFSALYFGPGQTARRAEQLRGLFDAFRRLGKQP